MRKRARRFSSAWSGVVAASIALTSAAAASGLGSGCCADLEERITLLDAELARRRERKVELQISGTINRALLYWNDGSASGVAHVDPNIDATSIRFTGSANAGGGWKVGFLMKFDTVFTASESVDQLNPAGAGQEIKGDRIYVSFQHENYGRITLGRDNSASRGIDGMELTNAEMTDSEIPDWNGAFLLRTKRGELLSDLPWGDFVGGKFAGIKGKLLTYTTPRWQGFEASTSHGLDYWDAALRYREEWAKTFRVRAGIGTFVNSADRDDKKVHNTGWGGSAAILHIPTGLNIAYNQGLMNHIKECEERSAVSNKCRGAETFRYVRGGIVRDFIALGATSLYGEYYRGRNRHNLSDDDTVNALAMFPLANPTELKSSNSHVWGVGVTQHVKAASMAIYAGYRHHSLDVELVDAAGAVADKGIKDLHVVFAGARIEF